MRKEIVILPSTEKILKEMGYQIKLARLRRNLPCRLICERSDISRPTLLKVERGSPDVAIGIYANVLKAIGGLDNDLLLVARDDVTGRLFQELDMKVAKRSKNYE